MEDAVLVSQANLETLLKALKVEFLNQLSHVTVFTDAGKKIAILDLIKNTGTGTMMLADDGTYKTVDTSPMISITDKTNQAWSILKIQQYVNGQYYPNIPEYQNLINQINTTPIKNTGDGTKFLNDAGSYVDVKVYKGMNTDQINSLCTDIIGGIL